MLRGHSMQTNALSDKQRLSNISLPVPNMSCVSRMKRKTMRQCIQASKFHTTSMYIVAIPSTILITCGREPLRNAA
ncbi:hypothetical protein DM02DRAFT_422780 [Periconia macrospinosa]|uniref:Uncharacterized protein n=1 Tax=Periconia macrospinosa TaxID=97972 RepID=A0A2V1E789_9PLEO|nr:hypothetical protein DM02DRAFT_422780 [Periconia macrospinosa]